MWQIVVAYLSHETHSLTLSWIGMYCQPMIVMGVSTVNCVQTLLTSVQLVVEEQVILSACLVHTCAKNMLLWHSQAACDWCVVQFQSHWIPRSFLVCCPCVNCVMDQSLCSVNTPICLRILGIMAFYYCDQIQGHLVSVCIQSVFFLLVCNCPHDCNSVCMYQSTLYMFGTGICPLHWPCAMCWMLSRRACQPRCICLGWRHWTSFASE